MQHLRRQGMLATLLASFSIGVASFTTSTAHATRQPTGVKWHRTTFMTAARKSPTVERLLEASAAAGPVGVDADTKLQSAVEAAASALQGSGEASPAHVPLQGTYDLVYSMAAGKLK